MGSLSQDSVATKQKHPSDDVMMRSALVLSLSASNVLLVFKL